MESDGFSDQSGVGRRHQIHPDGARLRIPGGDCHRLVFSAGARLALVQHVGDDLLRGGRERSCGTLRSPRDIQHGPGLSVAPRRSSPVYCLQLEIKISMDGKGRCIDNIFVSGYWRSLKYEEGLRCTPTTACRYAPEGIARATRDFFNDERPHKAVAIKRPRASTMTTAWRR